MSVAEAKEVVRRMGCIPSEFADKPSAWLETSGTLQIVGSRAVIR